MPQKNENEASGVEKYIKSSLQEASKSRREYHLYGSVYVYLQDFLPETVDIVEVLEAIENKIPPHLVNEVDTIFVGDFDYFDQKSITAMYDSGAIYVSHKQDSVEDMVDDIIHEIAHSLEQPYGFAIYSDEVLEKEFLQKRQAAYDVLSAHNYVNKSHHQSFMFVDYSSDFDAFLHKEVGYERLTHLLMGIYTTPYAATSLREYWSTGFEDYFVNDRDYLRKVSPKLFNKIDKLVKGHYDEY